MTTNSRQKTGSGWISARWGDIAVLEYGKGLRGYESATSAYQVFGTNGPIGWHDTPLCEHSTVVVGRKGAYRGIHYSSKPCYVIDTAFYLSPTTDFNMHWAYYQLLTQDINGMDSGSAIPSTSRDAFYQLPVLIPPRKVQDQIVSILGTLDEKIELNRSTNTTLESIARRLFKSWFIDFDPVHAKSAVRHEHPAWPNGRVSCEALPQLDSQISELFPDEFDNSTLGPIPKAWRDSTVRDAFEINPTRSLAKGSIAPWLEMANMPTHSARAVAWDRRPFGSGTKFINGDTLVARITPCLENGKTAFVDFLENGEVGAGSTEYIVLRPKSPLPPAFGYFLARNEDFRQHLITNMTGTSGRQRAPADCLNTYPIVVPDESIAKHFGEFAELVFAQMKANDEESMNLTAIRDKLLPKLLSGGLRTTA